MPRRRGGEKRGEWARGLLALVLCLALLGAPASSARGSNHDFDEEERTAESIDPIEPLNRAFFALNEALDAVLLLPLARVYQAIFPKPVRDSLRNFTRNLNAPLVLANDILQGEGKRAEVTLGRFLINTTLGVGGLFDPAKEMGLPHHGEDFGQTLGAWGVDPGIYLVLPLLGPSTFRDGLGRAADVFMDPLYYVGAAHDDARNILLGLRGGELIDTRERLIEPMEQLKKDPFALDHYALIRSVYLQQRKNAVLNRR